MTETQSEATEAQGEKDVKALQREAYGKATSRLRDNHRDEFNRLMAEEAKARGVEWAPRPTPEQRAAQELDKLIQENPHLESALRERYANQG